MKGSATMTTIYDNGNSDNNEYMNIRLTQKNAYLYFNYPVATSIVLIDSRRQRATSNGNGNTATSNNEQPATATVAYDESDV